MCSSDLGKKPWKQKGTGRARFGSTRNPIWRHGGVAFGRTGEENFTKKISKSAKKIAIRQALSIKNAEGAILIQSINTTGKTREIAKVIKDLNLEDKNVLMVVSKKAPEVLRATNNIANLKLVRATYLNVFDILNADKLIFSETAISATENWLLGKEEA